MYIHVLDVIVACCAAGLSIHLYPSTSGENEAQSTANLLQWLDVLLLSGTEISKARHQDKSFTTIYERIPESRFPEIISRLVTAPLNALSGACKNANLSAGHCYYIHAHRSVMAKHLCIGPFTSNT